MFGTLQGVGSLPLFPVLFGAGALLSAVIAGPIARRLQEPWLVVFGLGVSLSIVLAATVSPALGSVTGPCLREIARPYGPRGLWVQFSTDRALNTWMLVPLGFFAGYLAIRRWWVLVMALAVPFFVEGTQRVVSSLGRRCQFQDVIDNVWGVILGASLGIALGWFLPWAAKTVRR